MTMKIDRVHILGAVFMAYFGGIGYVIGYPEAGVGLGAAIIVAAEVSIRGSR
jgi:hypothetical protein